MESRQSGRGLAPRALAQELRRKGVGDEDRPRPRSTRSTPTTRRRRPARLVRKKLRSLRGVDTVTATRRLVGMLARKGYSSGLAFAVVRDELPAGHDLAESADVRRYPARVSTHVVVAHRGRELSGVAHEGESWAAAARRRGARASSATPVPVDLSGDTKRFVVDHDTVVAVRGR